jgi:transposase
MTIENTAKVRKTYPQLWHEYNLAQTNEKARLQELLFELCTGIDGLPQVMGRPRAPLSDVVFASCLKFYECMSGRRNQSDMREALQRGYLRKPVHYNTISKYLEREELTPILKQLITESSLPLKSVETCFAADSSGFATGQFSRWFDAKYGEEKQQHDWVKVHIMCGVKTNVITSVEVSGPHANDSPYFSPLLDATAQSGFQIKEVSADKGYDSFNNRRLTLVKGAIPYIPHREYNYNESEKPELWKRMYHFYKFNESEFKAHYHKRSNVETVFSMIKAKFGERLRSKTHAAQVNEVLCKVLCHNICCLVQSIYELGVEPTFWFLEGLASAALHPVLFFRRKPASSDEKVHAEPSQSEPPENGSDAAGAEHQSFPPPLPPSESDLKNQRTAIATPTIKQTIPKRSTALKIVLSLLLILLPLSAVL